MVLYALSSEYFLRNETFFTHLSVYPIHCFVPAVAVAVQWVVPTTTTTVQLVVPTTVQLVVPTTATTTTNAQRIVPAAANYWRELLYAYFVYLF